MGQSLTLFKDYWWGTSKQHPIDKALKNIHSIDPNCKEIIALLTTGSFCPVHTEHIRMLEVVKIELEKQGKTVLSGYLCPSHDEYVEYKMKKAGGLHIPGVHRFNMLQKALEDSSWLSADPWEISQVHFISFLFKIFLLIIIFRLVIHLQHGHIIL